MNSEKNILFIQSSLTGVGGIEKVVPTVAEIMSMRGVSVSAYVFYGHVPKGQEFWFQVKGDEEVTTTGVGRKVIKIITRAKNIIAFAKETKPTHIIVSAQGAIIITLLLKVLGLIRAPVIAYIHEGRNDGGRLYRVLTALMYPFADGFVGVSEGICKEIARIPFLKKKTIVRAYNAVDVVSKDTVFDAALIKKVAALARPLYVSAGRFEYTKGADVLVASWLDYAEHHKGTLLLIGSGSLESNLKGLILQRGLEERVCFLGNVPNARPYIALADTYLSCARSEPFGLALIEALAAGIPVIATDAPSGPREILAPEQYIKEYPVRGTYGILTANPAAQQEENSRALAKGISLLLEKAYTVEELQKRAADFTPQKQYDAIMKLVNTL